jgi:prepilin-type N-terminal cleavage/methylation domain-containing protein
MFARIRIARENESGFTLIELLIVIVILGVLSGIVVFSVSGITGRGAKAACEANVKTVQVAQEAYYAKSILVPPVYAASVAVLITANLLRAPAPTGITTSATGVVVAAPLCTTLT